MTVLLDQATSLHTLGRLDEAEKLYRVLLADDPQQPDALALLGVLLAARKDFPQAVSFLERAIEADPLAALFRFYMGNVFFDMDDLDRAEGAFREALARQPDFADAHFRLGLVFEKKGDLQKASEHLCRAAETKPDFGPAWVKLSEISLRNKDYAQAGKAADIAVQLMPHDLAAHIAQALAYDSLDREEDALDALHRALLIRPDFLQAWDMLGSMCQRLGRLDEAESAFRKAIAVAGASIDNEDGREVPEEDYSVHHWNLALLELLRGDFAHGFAHYRARFKKAGRAPRLPLPQPIWRGEELDGKKILLVGEQGFGDVLMMARFAPLLKAKGAKVVLLVHEALAEFMKASNLADGIICEAPRGQNGFDFQASLFDLPYRLKINLGIIPHAPYLPSPLVDEASRLSGDGRPKIGVVWAGKKDYGDDRRRSLSLAVFSDLFNETDAQFYNLTRDLNPGDAEILSQHGVIDLSPKLTNFYETAKLVAQLDLIVTCDTAMAHLAGGMGKNVWTLLPFAPDWRWLLGREDSPWYPSMRLFRQSKKADWAEVVSRVKNELMKNV